MIRLVISRPSKKKPESSGTAEYPQQKEALAKLGPHAVVTLHEDGDVTVKAQGKLYVVTTAGNVFEHLETGTVEPTRTPAPTAALPVAKMAEKTPNQPPISNLPTKEETTAELKRRLARELYKAELDLDSGLRIAGKPCDCLDHKHTLFLEAAAEEMISQEPANPAYQEIMQWVRDNQHKVTVAAIESGNWKQEYPFMANQFKDFRKRVMGTAAFTAIEPSTPSLTLEDAKRMAAEEAAKEVERQWQSAEKK